MQDEDDNDDDNDTDREDNKKDNNKKTNFVMVLVLLATHFESLSGIPNGRFCLLKKSAQ